MQSSDRGSFHLGDWKVEPTLGRISRNGRYVRLRPRAMDVLVTLALAAGELVSKRNLIDAVWRTEFVSDHALTQVIAEIRAALGDDARKPEFIQNIPRRGYRLVADVNLVSKAGELANKALLPFRLQGDDVDHPLVQGQNVIGRATDADIYINRTEVSRCHAKVVVQGSTASIEDLGSKNGTYLNGRILEEPTTLSNGDEIWIGRRVARLRFLIEGEPTQTEASTK